MQNTSENTFSFGDFELDAEKRRLLKQGEIIALNSKSFELLLVLVENYGRILTKDELLERVWEGQFVEENNLTVHISGLRKIFGEKKGEPQFIVTIPGKGYRFIANVRISPNGKNSEQDLVTSSQPVQENLNYYPETSALSDEGLIGSNGEIAEINSWLPPEQTAEIVIETQSLTFVPLEQTAEIVIETHKFERFRIEEEMEEEKNMPVVSLNTPVVSSNPSWLRKNSVRLLSPILLLAIIGGVIWLSGLASSGTPIPFANSNVRQLTTNGKVGLAALSPDGKLFAYTINDLGQRSLWLGYVDGGNHLQLRPAETNAAYFSLAFAPDSNQIYFSYKDDKTPVAAIYRTHVSGGVQEKIAEAVENFSLSSDGKQIAFARREGENDLLFVSNPDGTNSREIASFPKTESLVFESVSWSPDDKRLAFSKLRDALTGEQDLAIVEISNSKIESLKDDSLRNIAQTAWLKNGSGIIVSALKTDSQASVLNYNIFLVEIPSGKVREITGDLSSYASSLNLSQNSDAILTIEHRQLNNMWIAPADNLIAARQITFGSFGKYDGLWGMDFTPAGKIIYTNSDTKSQFISEINADGSGSKPLTTPGKVDSVLNVSNDGRYIVFHSTRGGSGMDIWRMDFDGGNPKQLTFGGRNFQPFVSTDNRWVYYKSWEQDTGELRRVSIDGGEPETINKNETSWLSFSPDGKYFAASYKTDQYRLAVFDAATNEVVKQFEIPEGGTLGMGSHWWPDSLSIVYRDYNFGYWRQNIEGGEPQKLEGLPKEKFYNFAFSKDGKWFAFVRGQEIRDVVVIRSTK